MKQLIVIAAMVAAFGLGGAAAFAASTDKPPSPPGQGECEHGNSQKPCKEDSQPDHGKDCAEHGNHGGVNEDHCKADETTTEETTTNQTTTNQTTTTEATTNQTTTTATTTDETTTESTPEDSDAEEDVEQEADPVVQVESAAVESQSGPAAVAAPARATKPSKAAQPAPLTP
jgi:cytoskeletal protein RodZ